MEAKRIYSGMGVISETPGQRTALEPCGKFKVMPAGICMAPILMYPVVHMAMLHLVAQCSIMWAKE
jgi:hypothetical protein